jgi:peptidoglycan/LPS O-acetylase OafA/YrhL
VTGPAGPADRRSGLDAIRAAAIVLVLAHHFRHLDGCPRWFEWFALRGYAGVDLFFVLSGWLIGGQVFRELARTDSLDLKRFWTRRWLRTLPSYAVILLVLSAVGRLSLRDLAAMVPFLQNYLAPSAWLASWSLCIEEQFYLALPLVILGLLRLRTISRPLALGAVAGLVLISPFLRLLAFPTLATMSYDDFLGRFYVPTHLRLDGLALCFVCAASATWRRPIWTFLERRATVAALLGTTLIIGTLWNPFLAGFTTDPRERLAFFPAVPGFFVIAIGVAFMLPSASLPRAPTRVSRLLAGIADHAYALYLTHELARDAVVAALGRFALPFAVILACVVAGTVCFALILRRFIESPALRYRDRPRAVVAT